MNRPFEAAPSAFICFCVPPGTASKAVLVVSSETMHAHGFLKLRKSMGLTQAQMAGLIRVPLGTVKAWEAGTPAGRSAILRSVRVKRPRL
jgi:DNA-binding transcriptional regulator YiaG